MSDFELITLKSGLKTLRSRIHGQTFHPVTGPEVEATVLHVEQQRLVERSKFSKNFTVWDVGFGAAANALVAISALRNAGASAEIHSFDKTMDSFEFALAHANELGYLLPHLTLLQELASSKQVEVTPGIRWKLHLGDFCETIKSEFPAAPHAILYDPYSATQNPEMWTLEHFSNLRRALSDDAPCIFSNYTCSTSVRVTLLLAGFSVGSGSAIGEKSQTTVATNDFQLLENPLDRSWLLRVNASSNAAPLRSVPYSTAKITPEDFELLQNCPQFKA